MSRVLLIFIDGVGVGSDDPDTNPFMRARLDFITHVFGDSSTLCQPEARRTARAGFAPLDAQLNVPGLPQSGTGQTALFTGINAPREFGRHFGPWVPTVLRERLARENLLTRAVEQGKEVAFANAYPEELFNGTQVGRTRDRMKTPVADPLRAGPPIAALGAGVLHRHTDALMRGDAVASEITNDGWRKHLQRDRVPVITAAEAGRNLARIAAHHDLTLFAHYSTDYIGHHGHMWEAVEALQKVDEFLGGVAAGISDDTTVMVASDHGNIEDIRTGHTINPALAICWGERHEEAMAGITSLLDVAPRLQMIVGVNTP